MNDDYGIAAFLKTLALLCCGASAGLGYYLIVRPRTVATKEPERIEESGPYRTLGVVAPEVRERTPAEILRAAGARPFEWVADGKTWCRKCRTLRDKSFKHGPELDTRICTGHSWLRRLFGFGRCTIRVEHFHLRCMSCKWKWIMEPSDISVAEENR